MPKRKTRKYKKLKGGSGSQRTVEGDKLSVTSMTKNNVVNLTPPDETIEPPFIGKPWTGNSMSLLPDGTFVEQPSNYIRYNTRFVDPQQFLLSSTNTDAPALVTAPHGYLHTHRHFHPHTGGKNRKKYRRKTHHKKSHRKKKRTRRKKRGGRKGRIFQEAVNIGRKAGDGVSTFVSNIEGVEPRLSSDPTRQPIEEALQSLPFKPANVKNMYSEANSIVGGL